MAAGVVSGTYGHALFELAVEKKAIDSLVEEAEVVRSLFEANPDFTKLLSHPRVDVEEKVAMTETSFRGRVSDEMTGFLCIMVKNGRQNDIVTALTEFCDEVREYRGIGVCHVVSAMPLTEDQKTRLTERLTEITKYRSFEMHYDVDGNLIGGMTVRIGDRVVDASIRTKLNELTKSLRRVSVDEQ